MQRTENLEKARERERKRYCPRDANGSHFDFRITIWYYSKPSLGDVSASLCHTTTIWKPWGNLSIKAESTERHLPYVLYIANTHICSASCLHTDEPTPSPNHNVLLRQASPPVTHSSSKLSQGNFYLSTNLKSETFGTNFVVKKHSISAQTLHQEEHLCGMC